MICNAPSKWTIARKCIDTLTTTLNVTFSKRVFWGRVVVSICLSLVSMPAHSQGVVQSLNKTNVNPAVIWLYRQEWSQTNPDNWGRGTDSEFIKLSPHLRPIVPSSDHWYGRSWLAKHEKLVRYVNDNRGPIDILLIGDSNTQQIGSPLDTNKLIDPWQKYFSKYRTINIGIDGDKTQNLLWRLHHGGVEGLRPRLVILMIGSNNMFSTSETGVYAVAKGIKLCASTLRSMLPMAEVVVVKLLPAMSPGYKVYNDIAKTNAALDSLRLYRDPKIHVVNLTDDFVYTDGSLKKYLFRPDEFHLSTEGYEVYSRQLKPIIEWTLE